jgi:uncharacterized phage protein (TIGR02218 family)
MKTISIDLTDHLEGELTSLCTCWHLTRRDATEFFFTDLDRDITIDGDTYLAASGYSRSAIENDSTLAVDNLDVQGFLDDDSITEEDLRAGLFDYAAVNIFSVNYEDISMGILKQRRGFLGEVSMTNIGIFKAELRGMSQTLSQRVGELYSPQCRADLGDTRCKVPLVPDLLQRSTAVTLGQVYRVATDTGATGQAQYENRMYEVTTAGTTAPTEPTYDTTVGNPTTEPSQKATAILRMTGQPSNGQFITIGSKSYTFQTVLTNVDGNVLIGATFGDSYNNLLAATTLGAGSGTTYAALTTAHTTVDFSGAPSTGVLTLTAKTAGSAGNAIATTETLSNATFDNAQTHLAGGTDGAVLTAREAWMRNAEIVHVDNRSTFGITVVEPRAVDDWFNGGVVIFESGDNDGHVIEIRNSDVGDKASSVLTITGQPSDGQVFTVAGKTYTMQNTLTNVDGHIHIGANTTATAINILRGLTLDVTNGGSYAVAMTAHTLVDFLTAGGNNILVRSKLPGSAANGYGTTENLSNASFTGRTLAGGSDQEITVFLPLPFAAQVGDLLRLYPGCDKNDSTCRDVFNNILNFRGEPFVPGQDEIIKYPDAKSG